MKTVSFDKRYIWGGISVCASIVSKFVAAAVALFSTRLTFEYLGPEYFGIWMTINTILGLMVFLEFGVGSGLVNIISQESSENYSQKTSASILLSFLFLGTAGIILLIILISIIYLVDISSLFNSSSDIDEKIVFWSLIALTVVFCINLPLNLVASIQLGRQKGYIYDVWKILGSALSLVAILVSIDQNFSMPKMLFFYAISASFAQILNIFFEFIYFKPLQGSANFLHHLDTLKKLFSSGILFTFLTILNLIGGSIDNLIIGQKIDQNAVAEYSVVRQLFSVLIFIVSISSPFWPAFGQAIKQGDIKWALKTFLGLQVISISIMLICLSVLVTFNEQIFSFWLGGAFIPNMKLVSGFAFLWLVSAIAQPVIFFLQTEKFLKHLLVLTVLYCCASTWAKVVIIDYYGSEGVIWSGSISYGVFLVIPGLVLIFNILLNQKKGVGRGY